MDNEDQRLLFSGTPITQTLWDVAKIDPVSRCTPEKVIFAFTCARKKARWRYPFRLSSQKYKLITKRPPYWLKIRNHHDLCNGYFVDMTFCIGNLNLETNLFFVPPHEKHYLYGLVNRYHNIHEIWVQSPSPLLLYLRSVNLWREGTYRPILCPLFFSLHFL